MQEYLRELQQGDLGYLADNLRTADKRELYAATGLDPKAALELSVGSSEYTWVMHKDGLPVGIVGGYKLTNNVGGIWMLATEGLKGHQVTFLRHCRGAIQFVFNTLSVDALTNYTYSENTLHHKWLEWCGAVFIREVPYGYTQENFIEFVILRTPDIV